MKHTSTLVFSCLLFFTASSQDWKFFSHYSLALPQQEMGKNIQAAHSLQAGALYQLPAVKNLWVGLQLGIGIYAHEKIDQTFTFDNHPTVVPVNYNSNVFNINLQTRYNLLNEKTPVVPYISAIAGVYNFFSNINIEDPDDPDGCHPIDRKNIINDKTLYWSAGGGLQINPDILLKRKRYGRLRIDFSANTIRGGTLNYINTKHLMDAQDMPLAEGKAIQMRFINASTQAIHEHTVAQVYSSSLRFMEFTAGVTVILGKDW